MLNIALHLYATRLSERLPCQPSEIKIVQIKEQGRFYWDDHSIWLNPDMPREMWRHVIIHEIGHACYAKWNVKSDLFGKPPHLTRYARVDKYEDFAETFTLYHLNKKYVQVKAPSKYRYMKSLIER